LPRMTKEERKQKFSGGGGGEMAQQPAEPASVSVLADATSTSTCGVDVAGTARQLRDGHITGQTLADMVQEGSLTKADRRKIVKLSARSDRKVLRLEVKEKKGLPKMSKDERRLKFCVDLEPEREQEAANFVTCLGCRKRGHYLKDCPRNEGKAEQEQAEVCFNCGSKDHSLKACTRPREKASLKFANCFICKQLGHISRDCPQNANGLYPNGGSCHICLQKTHLVKDCPNRTEEDREEYRLARERAEQNAEDDLKGVRVKGLVGDQEGDQVELSEDEGSDEEGGKKRKSKSQSRDKKSKKSKK